MNNFRKSEKSWRTNAVAILVSLIVIVTLILKVMEELTTDEMLTVWGGTAIVSNVLLGILSKDKQASHTYKDENPAQKIVGKRPGDRG